MTVIVARVDPVRFPTAFDTDDWGFRCRDDGRDGRRPELRARPEVRVAGAGSVLAFEIQGGLPSGKTFGEGLSLHSNDDILADLEQGFTAAKVD